MNTVIRVMATVTLLVSTNQILAQDKPGFPGAEALMSKDEFKAAGLHKLNRAERAALDRWLQRYKAGKVQVSAPAPQPQVLVPAAAAQASVAVAETPRAEPAAERPVVVPAGEARVLIPAGEARVLAPSDEERVLVTTEREVREPEEEAEILASIKQPFSGWSGNTVIYLENGQVWKQRRRGNYKHTGTDLRVKIDKNFMGYYRLTMLGSGKTVQVKRVR